MQLDALDQIAARAFDGFIVRKDLVRRVKGQYPVPTYMADAHGPLRGEQLQRGGAGAPRDR